MTSDAARPHAYDALLAELEGFFAENALEIRARDAALRAEISALVHEGLAKAKSRPAQFALIHRAIALAESRFAETARGIPKETIMSLARRAPASFMDGADLAFASLTVKYASPSPSASHSFQGDRVHGLAFAFSTDAVWDVFRLVSLAKTFDHLRGLARWLGKGGELQAGIYGLKVDLPPYVKRAVEDYEKRRARARDVWASWAFAPQAGPERWSSYRIPLLMATGDTLIEAPFGSDRWLRFERVTSMIDGGGLAKLLRGYEEALIESYGVGASPILHGLTALAVLILNSSPKLVERDGRLAFVGISHDQTEHEIGFAFGLGRKGFLRFPKSYLIKQLGRVRSPLAPDQATGEQLGKAFISAFTATPANLAAIDIVGARAIPFLHSSTDDHIYVDLLLLGDFLTGVLEDAKTWYSSQHGDRFVLVLKQWLNEFAPEASVGLMRKVPIGNGTFTDIDLLVRAGGKLYAVECKAFAKSRDFMVGAPRAVTQRRSLIRRAVRQAERAAAAFAADVANGRTEFDADTEVVPLVCTPTTEFLVPLDEYGMIADGIPRVVIPEELLTIATNSVSSVQ